jgi:hypothetical protein
VSRFGIVAALVLILCACTPLGVKESRAAKSSLSCMQTAIAGQDFDRRPDHEAHCVAAGLIALRCSVTEAQLASYGKELRDMLGRGDADWRDLRADRRGIACARSATDAQRLIACCEAKVE